MDTEQQRTRLRAVADQLTSHLTDASRDRRSKDGSPFHINALERIAYFRRELANANQANRLLREAIHTAVADLEQLSIAEDVSNQLFEQVRDDAEHELNHGGIDGFPYEDDDNPF